MNLKHLEYAVAVTQYGSIRKAAQVLLVSQPYLSGIIRSLEQELGYDIFIRSGSGISLTPNGKDFIRISKHILLEIEQIQNLGQNQELTPLNIACFHAPYIMEQFLNYHLRLTPALPDIIKEMDGFALPFIIQVIIQFQSCKRRNEPFHRLKRSFFRTSPRT